MSIGKKQNTVNSVSGYRFFRSSVLLFALFVVFLTNDVFAISKTSVATGDWNDPAVWNPIGIPAPTDDVTISATTTITVNANQSVHHTTIVAAANLMWAAGMRLTISGNLTVNGTANMNQGRITFQNFGQQFNLGTGASFTWDPDLNTLAEATLFTKGIENFSLTSTLIIKRWYNYGVSLGSLTTGDFGNLTINTPGANNTIVEWNQKNDLLVFNITANRFLRGMVRAIVGTLLDVGSAKFSLNDFENILKGKDRKKAGMNVPPEGLYLTSVKYPKNIFIK